MWSFAAICDEFCVHCRLFLKLDLDPSRETMVHYLERVRRGFPRMTRMRRRDDGGLILEEEGDGQRGRRYLRLQANALRFGIYSPPDMDSVRRFGEAVLDNAPPHLSLSALDYDYMDVVYVFDLEYRGNHDELVAETIFADHPLMRAMTAAGQHVIDCQPFVGVAVSPGCEKQAFLEIKGRTSTFELRSGEFDAAPLGVHVTARRYWGFGELPEPRGVHEQLLQTAQEFSEDIAVPHLVRPLAAAIARPR